MHKNTADDFQLASRMSALGLPIDLGEFQRPVLINQVGEFYENFVASSYLSRNGIGVGTVCHLTVVNIQAIPVKLCDFELVLPWSNSLLNLLPDPANPDAPEVYRFPGYSAYQYARGDVLPRPGILRRGQSLDGLLLAVGLDPIPSSFRNRTVVPVQLRIFDQFNTGHPTELRLLVDRSEERAAKPKATHRTRRSLFGHPDRQPKESTREPLPDMTEVGEHRT